MTKGDVVVLALFDGATREGVRILVQTPEQPDRRLLTSAGAAVLVSLLRSGCDLTEILDELRGSREDGETRFLPMPIVIQ